MNLARFSNPEYGVIHPQARVFVDGWESDIGTLVRYGWQVDISQDPRMDSFSVYFRNPSKNMAGRCPVDSQKIFDVRGTDKYLLYLDEQILLRAEFYRQIERPKSEIFQLDVGTPVQRIDMLRGQEGEWVLYNADKQQTEIIVTPEKVPMLLEEIRKAQAPRAKEIVHSQHRREYKELETKAKILAFA